jgi:hypothetical protein
MGTILELKNAPDMGQFSVPFPGTENCDFPINILLQPKTGKINVTGPMRAYSIFSEPVLTLIDSR